jgi:pimeloyl-ACP methyl ester carboxylesterase
MSPIHPQYTHEVSAALSKTDISKIKVLDSRKTTSALRAFGFSAAPVRHAVVVLLMSFGACSLLDTHRASAAVVGDASSAKSASPGKIAWHSCEGNPADVDCAQVQVPLDWNHANGPEITLAVARHRASKPNERIGSMFVNFGGPGVAGVPAVLTDGANLDKLGGGRFDVVGWDPRGTGDSTHIRCFENETSMEQFWGEDWTVPSTPASELRYVPKTVAYVARCTTTTGSSLLEHTSTADTVRDLDYLRQLVGDDRITYRGLSYGTFLGQTYINMFPKHVRAIILDANIDPVPYTTSVEAALFNNGGDTGLVFEQFLSLCEQAGQANCKLAGDGDVAARVRALLTRIRKGPIPAPRGPAPYELHYGDLLLDIWVRLGSPGQWPVLADELNQAANGDGSAVANTFHEARNGYEQALVSAVALQCADKPLAPLGTVLTFPKVMQHLTETNFLGPVEGWWLWAPCASWQVPSAERYTGPWTATTDNPILVIGNTYDNRTKFANSVLASRRLGNAVLLTLQGYGHTSDIDPSTCLDDAVTKYLVTVTTPPVGTICQPNHAPFDPDFGKPLLREQPID